MEILGVYTVTDHDNVWLLDISVPVSTSEFDFSDITQEIIGVDPLNWQVPWDERLIAKTSDGARWVFFFHRLDFAKPLNTPFGPIPVPPATKMPEELAQIRYETPC